MNLESYRKQSIQAVEPVNHHCGSTACIVAGTAGPELCRAPALALIANSTVILLIAIILLLRFLLHNVDHCADTTSSIQQPVQGN
jgi:hypothetical protein